MEKGWAGVGQVSMHMLRRYAKLELHDPGTYQPQSHFEEALCSFEKTALAVLRDRYFIDRLAIWLVEKQGFWREIRD